MEKFGKSQPVKRVEDVRFLTGDGRYVDDIAPADALNAFFFRSPVAHATITELDLDDARDAEGVRAVLTYADLEVAGMNPEMFAV
ncbi:MAG: carbon-monoxide dehydrogenase large subunit, partial [Gammaproteobacteria bacterium]